jgi:hypothetical protein
MSRRVVNPLLLCLLLGVSAAAVYPLIAQQTANDSAALDSISGTYSFLREGEFVQLTVEDGKLSGYLSRFGESESDKGQFIDQFFDKTALDGAHLSFNTKTVHGVWYEFSGMIATQPGKKTGEEGYRVIRGKLIQHSADEAGKEKVMQREVEFKSFPAEVNR